MSLIAETDRVGASRRADREAGHTLAPPAIDGAPTAPQVWSLLTAVLVAHDRRLDALEARRLRPDADRDGRLCGAIAIRFGSRAFAAADVMVSMDAELRAVLAGVTTRVLGAWLRRLHQAAPAPYVLRRVGRDDRGCVWELTIDGR